MTFTPADQLAVDTIRALSFEGVQKANSGHPGAPMGLAPLGWAVFSKLRKHAPASPDWFDRDRFVLSAGHASMLQYSLLHLTGYDLPLDELKNFRQWGSKTPGHPEYGHTPGVEITTGPLGQGFATAVGMAMAEHQLARRFNRPEHDVIDHHTWVIASDGDLMEGVSAEAASLAGHLGLGKLVVFWDDNGITIDGKTDITFTEDVLARFASYGWHTASVEDGTDLQAIADAGAAARAVADRPSLIRVRTVIGFPAPNKQGTSGAHGAPLGDAEIELTKKAMGWDHPPFTVPGAVSELGASVAARGVEARAQWQAKVEAYRVAFPSEAAELEDAIAGRLPAEWDASLPVFDTDAKGIASRKASGAVLQVLAKSVPTLVGGSADLAGSNNTHLKGHGTFGDGEGVPRNVNWGIREHAMASACNGLALHGGVLPYCATFLVFSDYMRPAIRLAALMNLPVKYVFTHDSIGLGEDGPTHQPVEHLAALRAIPNLAVFRPADANETREAWAAMMRSTAPTAIVLSRQNLPTVDRSTHGNAAGSQKGAYILRDCEQTPDAILIATGSEVGLALAAATQLTGDGTAVRVVSMPSQEVFAAQDSEYRNSVLPPEVRARVVIEAGIAQGWHSIAGDAGELVCMQGFGASAPAPTLFDKFGFTVDSIARAVARSVERVR